MEPEILGEILSQSVPDYLNSCREVVEQEGGKGKLPRVVLSLTTVPGRYEILYDTLRTLINQDYPVAAIYLTIPKIAKRWGTPYPALPQRILDMVTVVNVEEDYGPICKIIGGLLSEHHPDTLVVTCDDDIWYSPNLVSSLVYQYLNITAKDVNRKMAISSSGHFMSRGTALSASRAQSVFFHSWFMDFNVPEYGREVEILYGFAGVLYPRAAFPPAWPDMTPLEDLITYTRQSTAIFHNDDILLSAYLSSQSYKRVVVPDIPWVDDLRLTASGKGDENHDHYALSHDFGAMLTRMNLAYQDCLKFGLFKDHPNFDCSETVGGKVVLLIVVLIIIILLIWVICYMFQDSWTTIGQDNSNGWTSIVDPLVSII